ncbi:hypothetical protein PV08_05530 [Exophiala spinifera]|uniref:Uncharacterized protein n=1 Tax=Exophiala spinifera TaxID=91928 RepID=A0A0D2BW68_9EURO|nr:uncharacterized protein PV08_05530 [Exophiala spinifera]KIW15484.1 hypothetical protein PV08_05530 [Exophiala spinifera]
MPEARDLRQLSSSTRHRDEDESSDMYAASLHGSQQMAPESVPRARHMDDYDLQFTSSARGTHSLRSGSSRSNHSSARSGSRSTNSSSGGSRVGTYPSGRVARRRVVRSAKSIHNARIAAKARISFAFGTTLLIAAVIYLVLAFTRTARGIMFHVLSILFILTLAGVFFHQFLSMLMLKRDAGKRRRNGTLQSSTHRQRRRRGEGSTLETAADLHDMPPEKPIQIHMGGYDDDGPGPDLEAGTGNPPTFLNKPPPTYGNTRTSMRINPNFVYTKQVEVVPSPLTPTYDEAMSQVQHSVGYRPPSYLSDSGASEVIASQRRDVDAALENIHPLERERMRTLAAEALEGRSGSRSQDHTEV